MPASAPTVSPPPSSPPAPLAEAGPPAAAPVRELGGPSGPEPTRFGDWERNGRCIDF